MGRRWLRKDKRAKGKGKMIIISCPNCKKPIEATHAYKIHEGVAWHVNCDDPAAGPKSGKSIEFVEYNESKGTVKRTPGSGEG
jgi:hypothetical protein